LRGKWLIPVIVAAGLGLTGAGQAQTVPELRLETANEGIFRLPVPEEPAPPKARDDGNAYEPLGLRAGGLTLYSALEISGTVSSNVSRQTTGTDFGIGTTLKPSLRFESDWVRHSWTGEANGAFVRFLDHPDMATSSAEASTELTIDIRRATQAEFSAAYSLDADATRDNGVAGSEIGDDTVHNFTGAAGLVHDWGPLETRVTAGLDRAIYEDVALSGGGSQDNGDQDYWKPFIALRAGYTDPPVFKPFVEASYGRRLHDRRLDRNGQNRDADDIELRAGVAIDDDPIWSGAIAATYLLRDFSDAALASNEAIGISGAVTWSPTELTTFTLDLETALTDSQEAGNPGDTSWSGSLALTQALRDNLDLLADAGVTFEEDEVTYDGSLGLLWKLNRNLALTVGYDFTLVDASVAADGYSEHRVSAGIVLRH